MSYRADEMKVKTQAAFSSLCALAVLGTVGLSGCTAGSGADDASAPAAAASSTAPAPSEGVLLQPGGPGDPTVTGDAVPQSAPQPWNGEDATFVQLMVPHHTQALEMSALARTRARDPQVRALAERIGASQLPEIRLMTSWMQEQGLAAGDMGDMSTDDMEDMQDMQDMDEMGGTDDMSAMAGMEGMLSPAQLDRLAAAQGARFDRLFLRGMIAHHEGAVSMADDVTVDGSALQVSELAADVANGQTAEVDRMRDLLGSL